MEETLPNKGILEKLTREGKNLTFYTTVNKNWNPKQVITLKHLITYSNVRMYINPKGMIGMPIIGCHVWGHACGHDRKILILVFEVWIKIFSKIKLELVNCNSELQHYKLGLGWSNVATPLWAKCEGEAHTPKSGSWSPPGLPKTQSAILGVKSPRIWALLMSLESYWSVDVQNGLAWTIWTFATQVMGKRRARSQTGSLTPDH
jgi:hypothetical protein